MAGAASRVPSHNQCLFSHRICKFFSVAKINIRSVVFSINLWVWLRKDKISLRRIVLLQIIISTKYESTTKR
ncbi:hypothetical protein BpHYR1_037820 [Brachionus plicatilis]|uniref:Uncharacterized protein n=1 Tax=Brachionus plicatilis TaxID=10195 RepID=A0A3M7PJC5_BRAPC|nr:hypothetical protein BpHYR1_037820 [Brachionus plicatilis]